MNINISIARSKGFSLVDENTLQRNDCVVKYNPRNKNPYKVINYHFDKRGNVIAETVKHVATFYAAMRGVL